MDLLLRGGRVIDPAPLGRGLPVVDRTADVLVRDGVVAKIGPGLTPPKDGRVIDCSEQIVAPGFVDLWAELGEPGFEHRETLATGSRAAAAGGFTTVCCTPTSDPVNDSGAITSHLVSKAAEEAVVRIRPIGALTKGLGGADLAEIGEMARCGAVAVSNGASAVASGAVMRRALEYALTFRVPVVQHPFDVELGEGGIAWEGAVATRLGIPGIPPAAYNGVLARDLELAEWTGAHYHAVNIATARGIDLVSDARRRGAEVSVSIPASHLLLTEDVLNAYRADAVVMPPFPSAADRELLIERVASGAVLALVSGHCPQAEADKVGEVSVVPPGMIAFETTLACAASLVSCGAITWPRAVELLSSGPARLLGIDSSGVGGLGIGCPADLCVFDPDATFTVNSTRSMSRNTPFWGSELCGRAMLTAVAGTIVYEESPQ